MLYIDESGKPVYVPSPVEMRRAKPRRFDLGDLVVLAVLAAVVIWGLCS